MAKQRDSSGHYWSPLRANCENVPRLPGSAVRFVLDDPHGAPYLFVWREEGCQPVLSVRVARYKLSVSVIDGFRYEEPPIPLGQEWVSVTRPAPQPDFGQAKALQVVRVPMPRGGGKDLLLICPGFGCARPRRYLYAWEVSEYRLNLRLWQCRTCAGLRYYSEGSRGGIYYKPDFHWDPEVFHSPEQAEEVSIRRSALLAPREGPA